MANTRIPFEPRALPADTAEQFVRRHFREPRQRAVAIVDLPATLVSDRLRRVHCTVDPVDAHRCRVIAHVDSYAWLLASMLALDADFQAVEPPAFVEHCLTAARRLARSAQPPQRVDPV